MTLTEVTQGGSVIGCLDPCTQCQRTAPGGSTSNQTTYAALKCNQPITKDASGKAPATTNDCEGGTSHVPTYQDMYCVQYFGESTANAQASSNQGTPTAFSAADCPPYQQFATPTYPAGYKPPAGQGVCVYTQLPQSGIPGFNDYGWFDATSNKTLNCGSLPDGTACGGYLTGQTDTLPDGGIVTATYPGALGYTCQTVTFPGQLSSGDSGTLTAHLCLPPTTSGLGTCTPDSVGLKPLYTAVGGVTNASWLSAGTVAGGATAYYQTFKAACERAYTWQYDDIASGFGCSSAAIAGGQALSGFAVTFCN